jgi:hypothetical protein
VKPIQVEQIYVVAAGDDGFWIGGDRFAKIPWNLLGSCHLYAVDEDSLTLVLHDAADEGWHVFEGSSSDRRGITGFTVGIGPWGVRGEVQCRKMDAWAVEDEVQGTAQEVSGLLQDRMRELVRFFNDQDLLFRPTALRMLRSAYERYGRPWEPRETMPPVLPPDVAKMCRRAHVGGPILHVKTSLAPWTAIDRVRAYGQAMLADLPAGDPVEVTISGLGLDRWTEVGLMRAMGIADATVRLQAGPLTPLLPVMKWNPHFERSRAMYPTGVFRGCFTMMELAHVERSGLGRVEQIHRAVTFERSSALAHVVRKIRVLEKDGLDQLVSVKRLEHMLYGWCSRSLSFSRFGSTSRFREPVVQELVDVRTLERLTTRVELRPMGRKTSRGGASASNLQLYEVRGSLSERTAPGTMDRPDRSAWITASNRVEVSRLILELDRQLSPSRSGQYVGRVYVDGLDVEALPDQLKLPDGWVVRGSGSKMRIFRPSITVRTNQDGTVDVEDGGLLRGTEADEQKLEQVLLVTPEIDSGAFASGRWWPAVPGVDDPRMLPDQVSEPVDLAEGIHEQLRWDQVD